MVIRALQRNANCAIFLTDLDWAGLWFNDCIFFDKGDVDCRWRETLSIVHTGLPCSNDCWRGGGPLPMLLTAITYISYSVYGDRLVTE